jgi:hypothetical protein
VWDFFHKCDLFNIAEFKEYCKKSQDNLAALFIFVLVHMFIYNFCLKIDIIAILGLINNSITVVLLSLTFYYDYFLPNLYC